MFRIAAVRTDHKSSLYDAAIARTNGQFDVVGRVDHVEALANADFDFDACVVHDLAHDELPALNGLIQAGKHLLLDLNQYDLALLDSLTLAGKTSDMHVAVTQPGRFTSYATTIRDSLDAGHLGTPGLVRIHRWKQQDQSAPAQSADLWSLATREVDLACWMFDATPETIFAQSIAAERQQGFLLHLGFGNGMAVIDCVCHNARPLYTVSLIGSSGAAYADDHHNTNLLLKGDTLGRLVADDTDAWRIQLEHFVRAAQANAQGTSIADAKRAVSVTHAAVQAASKGCVARREGDQYELQ